MDEDDPVARECNVYLSTKLANQLFLVQYPLRPKHRDALQFTEGRFKPKQQILEMSYDVPKDEHFDQNAPSNQRPEKFVYTSSRNPAKVTYAVGMMANDELHLSPVKSTFVMRPSLAFRDKEDLGPEDAVGSRSLGPQGVDDDAEDGGEEGDENGGDRDGKAQKKGARGRGAKKGAKKGQEVQEVNVELVHRRDYRHHQLSFLDVENARKLESWVNLSMHPPSSAQTTEVKAKMICSSPEAGLPTQVGADVFLQSMHTAAAAEFEDSAADPEWRSLASPNYPGFVDSQEWIAKRKLRYPGK